MIDSFLSHGHMPKTWLVCRIGGLTVLLWHGVGFSDCICLQVCTKPAVCNLLCVACQDLRTVTHWHETSACGCLCFQMNRSSSQWWSQLVFLKKNNLKCLMWLWLSLVQQAIEFVLPGNSTYHTHPPSFFFTHLLKTLSRQFAPFSTPAYTGKKHN